MLDAAFDLFASRPQRPARFLDDVRSFDDFGAATREEQADGVPHFVNEFWTARQRQAHSLHEISYRACFKPQLPAFFISRLTRPGETVYDPFMGRGTTVVEAALMGRRAIGNDINPLSVCLTRPRLNPPTPIEIERRLGEIPWQAGTKARDDDLLVFFHPETLAQILALRAWLMEREAQGKRDATDDWIRMVALNRLTGHSPGFFSVYTMPPNQAVSAEAQRKINARRQQRPSPRDVPTLILKKSRRLLKDGGLAAPPALLLSAPAARTPEIAGGAVDLIVTSPPFLDVVGYAGDNWLRCWFAGIEVATVPITNLKKEPEWRAFVRDCFKEFARVVRPGGHVAFEVGEVRGGRVLLEKSVLAAVAGLPFEALGVLVNAQAFTKTANCWGVANNAKGTNSNRIVVVRRK